MCASRRSGASRPVAAVVVAFFGGGGGGGATVGRGAAIRGPAPIPSPLNLPSSSPLPSPPPPATPAPLISQPRKKLIRMRRAGTHNRFSPGGDRRDARQHRSSRLGLFRRRLRLALLRLLRPGSARDQLFISCASVRKLARTANREKCSCRLVHPPTATFSPPPPPPPPPPSVSTPSV